MIDASRIIADGAKLDNLIQIGHNCHIGENTAMAACSGISGSTRIGRNCTIAGAVGMAGHLEIGDDVPLVIDGYRLYTTSNKGFAALLTWLPEQGDEQLGAVQFPSYPAKELGQATHWSTPAGERIEFALALPPSPYNETWTLSAALAGEATIELKVAGEGRVLRPGDLVTVTGGRLRYEGLSMWMGYELTYDPTLPWLFSIAVLAVVFMSIHFAARLLRPVRTGAVDHSGYPA